jgi:hypothetical protein
MRRHAHLLAEGADEVVDAQAGRVGQLVERGRLSRRIVKRGEDYVVDPAVSRTTKSAGPMRLWSATAVVQQAVRKTVDACFEQEQIVRVTSRCRDNDLHRRCPQFAIMRVV